MKSILFVADVSLRKIASGSEQVLYNQASYLQQLGHRCCAITRSNEIESGYERNTLGVHEICYYANPNQPLRFTYNVLKNSGKIYDKMSERDPFNIALCHQPFNSFALISRGRLTNIPMLYVFHSPCHEEYLINLNKQAGFFHNLQARVRRAIEKFCLKKAKFVIVLSNYMKQKVIFHHGIAEDKILVNPGGVDTERFSPILNRSDAKVSVGYRKNHLHILTIRNLEKRMGLTNLILAIEILKQKSVKCHLIIGGSGPERERLEEVVIRHNLEGNVTFTGFISNEQLPVYYSAADFFVIPSQALEGFGLVTPESMACGTPVLGTPVGGTSEILFRFNKNFLFKGTKPHDIAEGIKATAENVFNNKLKYRYLRKDCRNYACKYYTWKKHIQKLNEVITVLTSEN